MNLTRIRSLWFDTAESGVGQVLEHPIFVDRSGKSMRLFGESEALLRDHESKVYVLVRRVLVQIGGARETNQQNEICPVPTLYAMDSRS